MNTNYSSMHSSMGQPVPTPNDHNLMAVALNQYFVEFDPSQFAPCVEDGFANND